MEDLDLFEAFTTVDDRFKKLINDCVYTLESNGFKLPIRTQNGDPKLKFKMSDSTTNLGAAYYPSSKHNGNYLITLSRYLDELTDEQIKNTIYHELGHILSYMEERERGYIYFDKDGNTKLVGETPSERRSSKKSLYHHGSGWQYIMKQISKLTGQPFQRLADAEESTAFNRSTQKKFEGKPIYKFICPSCGSKLEYTKRTKFVQTYDRVNNGQPSWWCTRCQKRTGKKIAFIKDEGSA